MSVMLDHEDLVKARKALVIMAFVVLGLPFVQLSENELSFLGLKFIVNTNTLTIFAKLGLVYLLFNFAILAYVDTFESRLKKLKDSGEYSLSDLLARAQAEDEGTSGYDKNISDQDIYIKTIEKSFQSRIILVTFIREKYMPIVLAFISFFGLHKPLVRHLIQ